MNALDKWIFDHRKLLIGFYAAVTIVLSYSAANVQFDSAFEKYLPRNHPFIQTYLQYDQEFGGANRIQVAIRAKQGDIFTASFFKTIESITNEIRFLPGVNRSTVRSIFTPNVRYIEIVEDGFAGGNVVSADFRPTPEGLAQVRKNILRSDIFGQLVSGDFSSVMVEAELLGVDPITGTKLDYFEFADQLENEIREKYAHGNVDVHIIGFSKIVADVAAAAFGVVVFFGIAFIVTAGLVYMFSQSILLVGFPLLCSVTSVVWTMGLLSFLGFGLDPLSILVPFVLFGIGVSHGLQMVNHFCEEIYYGANNLTAAKNAFCHLRTPGGIALGTDALGFLTILLVDVRILQEFAIISFIGVAFIALTNLLLLPVLLSYVSLGEDYRKGLKRSRELAMSCWRVLAKTVEPKVALSVLTIAIGLFVVGWIEAGEVHVGNSSSGVSELHPSSRYNRDLTVIAEKFSKSLDTLVVFVETIPNGCLDYEVMTGIDDFQWHVNNIKDVQFTKTLPQVVKMVHAGLNEGYPKWRVLPRSKEVIPLTIEQISQSSRLMNHDCSVLPIYVFLEDHKAETITEVIEKIQTLVVQHDSEKYSYRLAAGNVGVIAARNEVVRVAQVSLLIGIYSVIALVCFLIFRSWRIVVCLVMPLALVSVLAYSLMHFLNIGLKIVTLPVIVLGVGIGVDYGIYVFNRFKQSLDEGLDFYNAYLEVLRRNGYAVLIAGLTLTIGVGSWIFSNLQFQADMGLLLAFLFFANMLGALILLPAIASVIRCCSNTKKFL